MNETKIQVKPNLEMHEIYMHIYKADWTVLSADKAEGKICIELFSRFVRVILLPPKYLKMVRLHLFLEFHV